MDGPTGTGAKIRLLTEGELDLASFVFGGTAYCRAAGCLQKARWSCLVQAGESPKLFCDGHARQFAKDHGIDHNF